MMDRRSFLTGTAALALAPMMPPAVVSAAVPELAPIAAAKPFLGTAWAVGSPGDWNWEVIRAPDADTAFKLWRELHDFGDDFVDLDAKRKPEWDHTSVTAGDSVWFANGMGSYCDRCSNETFQHHGGEVIAGEIVCQECMAPDDWRIIDPENDRGWLEPDEDEA